MSFKCFYPMYVNGSVQRGVNIGLRQPSLEFCPQRRPVAGLWGLGFQEGPHCFLTDKSGSLYRSLNCLCEPAVQAEVSFPLGAWAWVPVRRWLRGHRGSSEPPRQTLPTGRRRPLREEFSVAPVTPPGEGEDSWTFTPGFLWA